MYDMYVVNFYKKCLCIYRNTSLIEVMFSPIVILVMQLKSVIVLKLVISSNQIVKLNSLD